MKAAPLSILALICGISMVSIYFCIRMYFSPTNKPRASGFFLEDLEESI